MRAILVSSLVCFGVLKRCFLLLKFPQNMFSFKARNSSKNSEFGSFLLIQLKSHVLLLNCLMPVSHFVKGGCIVSPKVACKIFPLLCEVFLMTRWWKALKKSRLVLLLYLLLIRITSCAQSSALKSIKQGLYTQI